MRKMCHPERRTDASLSRKPFVLLPFLSSSSINTICHAVIQTVRTDDRDIKRFTAPHGDGRSRHRHRRLLTLAEMSSKPLVRRRPDSASGTYRRPAVCVLQLQQTRARQTSATPGPRARNRGRSVKVVASVRSTHVAREDADAGCR